MGQILEKVMQKGYLEKEMVDAGEFIDQLLDRLFADGIVENPFETLLAHLNQCVRCEEIISTTKSGILIREMQFDYSLLFTIVFL